MSTLLIKSDNKNSKVMYYLAKKSGAKVQKIDDELFEDFAFGKIIEVSKTNENCSTMIL